MQQQRQLAASSAVSFQTTCNELEQDQERKYRNMSRVEKKERLPVWKQHDFSRWLLAA
jgi:hypothetical protein